jgi:hypothetical protein
LHGNQHNLLACGNITIDGDTISSTGGITQEQLDGKQDTQLDGKQDTLSLNSDLGIQSLLMNTASKLGPHT